MILMDGIHTEMDTCIIVEYKGNVYINLSTSQEINVDDQTHKDNGIYTHKIIKLLLKHSCMPPRSQDPEHSGLHTPQ